MGIDCYITGDWKEGLKFIELPCEICNNDGICLNDKNNPNYDDFYSDYLDCWVYVRNHESSEQKLKREQRVEIWDIDKKEWIKKDVS